MVSSVLHRPGGPAVGSGLRLAKGARGWPAAGGPWPSRWPSRWLRCIGVNELWRGVAGLVQVARRHEGRVSGQRAHGGLGRSGFPSVPHAVSVSHPPVAITSQHAYPGFQPLLSVHLPWVVSGSGAQPQGALGSKERGPASRGAGRAVLRGSTCRSLAETFLSDAPGPRARPPGPLLRLLCRYASRRPPLLPYTALGSGLPRGPPPLG